MGWFGQIIREVGANNNNNDDELKIKNIHLRYCMLTLQEGDSYCTPLTWLPYFGENEVDLHL